MGTATGQAPHQQEIQVHVTGRAAADATLDETLGRVKYTGVVSAVTYTPDAAIDTTDTNSLTLSLLNGGDDGTGVVVIATLALPAAVADLAKHDERTITLSATAADLDVAAGDVLIWRSGKVGTGLLDPGGIVKVLIDRD